MLTELRGYCLQFNEISAEKELKELFSEILFNKYRVELQFFVNIEKIPEIETYTIVLRMPYNDKNSLMKWENIMDSLMMDYYEKFNHEIYGYEIGLEELEYELPKILLEEMTGLKFEEITNANGQLYIEFL